MKERDGPKTRRRKLPGLSYANNGAPEGIFVSPSLTKISVMTPASGTRIS
jgi:hypothetical protein